MLFSYRPIRRNTQKNVLITTKRSTSANKKKNKLIKKAVENYEVLTGDAEVKRLAEIKLMSDLDKLVLLSN